MRIQNEIVGERFNRFTDMVDLDRLATQEIVAQARTGAVGVPRLIRTVMNERSFSADPKKDEFPTAEQAEWKEEGDTFPRRGTVFFGGPAEDHAGDIGPSGSGV